MSSRQALALQRLDPEWRIWHGAWTTYLPELREKITSLKYELQATSSTVGITSGMQNIA
jgi:hypothetical protein